MLSEPVMVVVALARVFDALGISYLVGGSVASSIYGIPRATQDVDLVADVRLSHVDAIMSALASEFYIDADMVQDAVKRRTSFNVIHLATMFKADVFILKRDEWSREEMARARAEQLEVLDGKVTVRFASPEDTLLHKLVWYKLGNQISDRQWGDILGVLKIQGEALDQEYLDRWALQLDVLDLLLRARKEQQE
jgi:predicted ribonuclease toxin of YeeF-YezG toxin-antitoxin module